VTDTSTKLQQTRVSIESAAMRTSGGKNPWNHRASGQSKQVTGACFLKSYPLGGRTFENAAFENCVFELLVLAGV
jgi:hypothetical protein